MSQPLQYSLYEKDSKTIRKNKTYKKKPPTKKVKSFLQAMDDNSGPADFDTSNIKAESSEYPAYPQKPEAISRKKNTEDDDDNAVENFTQLPETASSPPNMEYYKQYVPYYTNASAAAGGTNTTLQNSTTELMEKIKLYDSLIGRATRG